MRDPTNAEEAYAILGGYLKSVQQAMLTAPISPEERAKLGTMVASYFFSTAVDFSLAPKPDATPVDLEETINQLTPIVAVAARANRKPVFNA